MTDELRTWLFNHKLNLESDLVYVQKAIAENPLHREERWLIKTIEQLEGILNHDRTPPTRQL